MRWTVRNLAQAGADVLAKRSIESARLDSDLLLAHVLGLERLELYTRFDMPVSDEARAQFRTLIERRRQREPVAYILGRRDFLDWTFAVGPGVLIPRPETELVVDAGSIFLEGRSAPRIIEFGVGSGCIVVSLLARFPNATALGVDIEKAPIAYTSKNAETLSVRNRLELIQLDMRDLLENGQLEPKSFDLVISNPPYITKEEAHELESDVVDFEPSAALFCANDGLAFHRQIVASAKELLRTDGGVVLELPAGGGERMLAAGKSDPWTCAVLPDYAGLDRVFLMTQGTMPTGFSSLHGARDTSEESGG